MRYVVRVFPLIAALTVLQLFASPAVAQDECAPYTCLRGTCCDAVVLDQDPRCYENPLPCGMDGISLCHGYVEQLCACPKMAPTTLTLGASTDGPPSPDYDGRSIEARLECPDGYAITGVRYKDAPPNGSNDDATMFAIICSKLSDGTLSPTSDTVIVKAPSYDIYQGTPHEVVCESGKVAFSVVTQDIASSDLLDGITLRCAPIRTTGSEVGIYSYDGVTLPNGDIDLNGSLATSSCPHQHVLTGFDYDNFGVDPSYPGDELSTDSIAHAICKPIQVQCLPAANPTPTPTATPTSGGNDQPTPTPTPTPTNTPGGGSANNSAVAPFVDCVVRASTGPWFAVFGYDNQSTQAIVVKDAGVNSLGANATPVLTTFQPGHHRGALTVPFTGTVTWTVQAGEGQSHSATADAKTPQCEPIVPVPLCIERAGSDLFSVGYGYNNQNDFDVDLAIGAGNSFSPPPADRGQPTGFFTGFVADAVRMRGSGATPQWTLFGTTVRAEGKLPSCGECVDIPVVDMVKTLNADALTIARITKKCAQDLEGTLAATCRSGHDVKTASEKKACAVAEARVTRSQAKALKLLQGVERTQLETPQTVSVCAKGCHRVDNLGSIKILKGLVIEASNQALRLLGRKDFLSSGGAALKVRSKRTRAVKTARARALKAIGKLPRFSDDGNC